MRLVLTGFPRPQALPYQQGRAAGDGRIRHIERGPVVAGHVKIEKIDHRAQPYSIDHIADGAAQNQRQCEAEQCLARILAQQIHDPHYGDDGDSNKKSALPAPRAGQKTERRPLVMYEYQVEKRRDFDAAAVRERACNRELGQLVQYDQYYPLALYLL